MVLVRRIVSEDVHLQADALLDQCLANSSRADHCNRLAADLIAEKGQKRMPRSPLVFAHQLFTWPELARDYTQGSARALLRSIEHTSRSHPQLNLVCRLLREIETRHVCPPL